MAGGTVRRNLVLFGAPGSGKGTQAELLREHYGLDHIAPGDMLRQHRDQGTELGRVASGYMAAGKLVPDEIIVNMIRRRLEGEAGGLGFVLDGFPRTLAQARALQELLAHLDRPLDMVVVLDVPAEVIMGRLGRRAQEEHRDDDRPDVIKERLQVYRQQTEPVLEYLGREVSVVHVNGAGTTEDVSHALVALLA